MFRIVVILNILPFVLYVYKHFFIPGMTSLSRLLKFSITNEIAEKLLSFERIDNYETICLDKKKFIAYQIGFLAKNYSNFNFLEYTFVIIF